MSALHVVGIEYELGETACTVDVLKSHQLNSAVSTNVICCHGPHTGKNGATM